MAGAKLKEGLDYFPMPTRKDMRFKIIRALHGSEGYVILNTLLQDIHGEKGYYVKWNERLAKIFALENGFNIETTIEVVKECLSEGIFDEVKFKEYEILTSADIQLVWINVAKERKVIIHKPEFLLIDISQHLKGSATAQVNGNQVKNNQIEEPGEIAYHKDNSEGTNASSISSGINSINPGINLDNLSDNSVSKGSKETKANEAIKANQFKQEEKSEAFNFSLKAETVSSDEKVKFIKNEKFKIIGENFLVFNNQNLPGKQENRTIQKDEKKEISGRKSHENSDGTKKNIPAENGNINLGSPVKEIVDNTDNQINKDKIQGKIFQDSEEKKSCDMSKSKTPHPARSQIINLWREKFGQPYRNSLTGNRAINEIIWHLDELVRQGKKEEILLDETAIPVMIIDLWKVVLANWNKLEKFYRNQIRFESISKNLPEIINQLKDYGTNRNSEVKSGNSNYSKPSFDRFRKKNG